MIHDLMVDNNIHGFIRYKMRENKKKKIIINNKLFKDSKSLILT